MIDLRKLLQTPTGQQMIAEHEAATGISEDDRVAAAEEYARLLEPDPEIERLIEEKREAEAAADRLEEDRKTARADVRAIRNRIQGVTAGRDARKRDLLKILRDSAPPEVRELREWAKETADEERKRSLQTKSRRLVGGRDRATHWNKPSIERRIGYLISVAAHNGLADQAIELGDVHDVRVRCAEIKAGLDEIPVKFEKIRR